MRLAGRVAASLGSSRLAESLGPCQLHTDWRDDDINIIWDYSDVFFINISSDLIEYSYNLGLKNNVLTSLLYDTQSWKMTKTIAKKFEVFQRNCLTLGSTMCNRELTQVLDKSCKLFSKPIFCIST